MTLTVSAVDRTVGGEYCLEPLGNHTGKQLVHNYQRH